MVISPSAHITELAQELVDDVELSRLAPEQLVLKASRLARLVGDGHTSQWLEYELNGYPATDHARAQALQFGRIESADAKYGYLQPLAGITGVIATMQAQIQRLEVPNIQFAPHSANPNELVMGFSNPTVVSDPVNKVLERLQICTTAVTNLTSVRSRVLGSIHAFAVRVYYERAFSGLAENIFEQHKATIDQLIAAQSQDVLKKIPAIYDRLNSGDHEAVSQAMNSVRRMIKAFADAVYPPGEGTTELDGQQYEIGDDKVLNRIKLYLNENCQSATRCARLNKNLREVYQRVSAGVHAEVTPEEARALFLQAYLTLGEILSAVTSSRAGAPRGIALLPHEALASP